MGSTRLFTAHVLFSATTCVAHGRKHIAELEYALWFSKCNLQCDVLFSAVQEGRSGSTDHIMPRSVATEPVLNRLLIQLVDAPAMFSEPLCPGKLLHPPFRVCVQHVMHTSQITACQTESLLAFHWTCLACILINAYQTGNLLPCEYWACYICIFFLLAKQAICYSNLQCSACLQT